MALRRLVWAVLVGSAVVPGMNSGCSSSPSTPTTPTVAVPNPPPGATAAMVSEGSRLYSQGSCSLCHGQGGRNGQWGPDLTDSVFLHNSGTFEEIAAVIAAGVPADRFKSPNSQSQFFMQPRGGMALSDEQLRALAAYVWTLSHPG